MVVPAFLAVYTLILVVYLCGYVYCMCVIFKFDGRAVVVTVLQ